MEHFAWQSYQTIISKNQNYKSVIYAEEERRVRQDFNIWELCPLQRNEKTKLLKKAVNLKDAQLRNGLTKLQILSKSSVGTIQHELMLLSNTPGYFLPVIRLLATNQYPSLVEIYEECINSVVIEFNIESDRAMDKYKTITSDRKIDGHSFAAEQKNSILRKLAWYMIERGIDEFDINEFPKFIMEIEDIDFEVVLSDLQTQTVITLKEDGRYSFVTKSIFSFYIANYLYLSLSSENPEESLRGIQNLGKYDLSENDILSKARFGLQHYLLVFKRPTN